MTKRLDAIRQRLPEPTTNETCKQDIEYLLSLVENQREALKKVRLSVLIFKDMAEKEGWDFNVDKELEPIEQALKCEEGGEMWE